MGYVVGKDVPKSTNNKIRYENLRVVIHKVIAGTFVHSIAMLSWDCYGDNQIFVNVNSYNSYVYSLGRTQPCHLFSMIDRAAYERV